MPLLTSPIDGSPMRQIHRYGIEIDVCPTSGSIWLDRGELEKILHLMSENQVSHSNAPEHDRQYGREDHDYLRYKEKGYYGSGKYHKKESKLSKMMDLFDF